MNITRLKKQLVVDEGFRPKPYRCSAGKLTIGIGRNIEDMGIARDEAEYMLHNDIENLLSLLWIRQTIEGLDDVRAEVILNMAFNLGSPRLFGFKKMRAALESRDFERAADEMKDSAWYSQVGSRAVRLVEEMRTGVKGD